MILLYCRAHHHDAPCARCQELIDYATSSRAKFINGDVELNDETWQKYLDTLESYGMSDYIEMCQRAYDRYSALPETID